MTDSDKTQSVHFGQTEGSYTALMNIFISFDDLSKNRNSKYLMKALTGTFKHAAPLIEKNYGRVIKVSGSGISAVFEKSADDALICGISICQQLCAVRDISDDYHVSVGLTYGKVFISDVVCGSFSSILAVSQALDLSCSLSVACLKSDASILITENLADHIIGFKNRFGSRKIGIIYNSAEKKGYSLFDVFDGDPVEKKYSKRRSRLLCETGVEHFLEGRPLQARSCFIELLKYDRSDMIAKRYIYLCDKAISGSADNIDDKYLGVL